MRSPPSGQNFAPDCSCCLEIEMVRGTSLYQSWAVVIDLVGWSEPGSNTIGKLMARRFGK